MLGLLTRMKILMMARVMMIRRLILMTRKDDDDRKDDDIVQGVQCLSEESGLPARCEPSQLPESANNLHHQIRTGFQVMFSNKSIKKVQTIIIR